MRRSWEHHTLAEPLRIPIAGFGCIVYFKTDSSLSSSWELTIFRRNLRGAIRDSAEEGHRDSFRKRVA